MSTWRCGWICPRSYLFAAVFLAGVSAPCERRSIATSHNTVGAPPATYNVPSV